MKYKAIIQYNGKHFAGYAKQNNERTVEGELEKALKTLLKKKTAITVAGRTDAGVHALGQVISFEGSYESELNNMSYRLNSILPSDICITSLITAEEGFDARRSARARQYVYYILNRSSSSSFHDDCCYHFAPELDIKTMRKASQVFVGKRDFKSFSATSLKEKSFMREVSLLNIENKSDFYGVSDNEMISIRIKANAFLHNMVRIIVGTLIEVGRSKLSVEEVEYIINSRDRRNAGPTASAKGLFLERVEY